MRRGSIIASSGYLAAIDIPTGKICIDGVSSGDGVNLAIES